MKLLLTSMLLLFLPNCFWKQKDYCPYAEEQNDWESEISEWRSIRIGGVKQFSSIRGKNRKLPILLFLHGGPGTPETPFLSKYNSNLEKEFILVSWEMRGSGRSFSTSIPEETMTIDQLVKDTIEVTEYLKVEFNHKKVYLVGHSWGIV
ncbi:MAG: hypothetical protein JJT78_10710 [Leptospira sp.]|nr:hypothetical protein [Leptospira sp.]